MLRIVYVALVLDVPDEASAYDGANELLREQQRHWVPSSCLLDYTVGNQVEVPMAAEGYEEGAAFAGGSNMVGAPSFSKST